MPWPAWTPVPSTNDYFYLKSNIFINKRTVRANAMGPDVWAISINILVDIVANFEDFSNV